MALGHEHFMRLAIEEAARGGAEGNLAVASLEHHVQPSELDRRRGQGGREENVDDLSWKRWSPGRARFVWKMTGCTFRDGSDDTP